MLALRTSKPRFQATLLDTPRSTRHPLSPVQGSEAASVRDCLPVQLCNVGRLIDGQKIKHLKSSHAKMNKCADDSTV